MKDLNPYSVLYPFTKSDSENQSVIDAICAATGELNLPSVGARSVKSIKEQLAPVIQGVVSSKFRGTPTKFEREWYICEGVGEYLRRNIFYDTELLAIVRRNNPTTYPEIRRRELPEGVLAMREPGTVCVGFALLGRDILREFGISSRYEDVRSRGWDEGATIKRPREGDHAVAVAVLDGGYEAYLDISRGRSAISDSSVRSGRDGVRRTVHGKSEPIYVMPRHAVALEVFFAGINQQMARETEDWKKTFTGGPWKPWGDAQDENNMYSLPFEKWALLDTRTTKSTRDAIMAYCLGGPFTASAL